MEQFKNEINLKIEEYILTYSNNENEKELLNHIFEGGKRLRPMICLAIGNSFNTNYSILDMALAIELIHNSSLIIDDLPCMDNDQYRRGILTVHAKYGENTAIQIAIKLMMDALNKIYKVIEVLPNKMTKIYQINNVIYKNLGRDGLPMGQYIDLNFLKNNMCSKINRKEHTDLIFKKTTTLFNLSFMLSYLLYVNDENKINIMEKTSKWFGLAFQLYDDFLDIEQDKEANSPNFINQYGYDETLLLFKKSIEKTRKYLQLLDINMLFFDELFTKLESTIPDKLTSIM
jgi:geranylgeranyl diphosphate synthase type II